MKLTEKSSLFIYRKPTPADLTALEGIQAYLQGLEPRVEPMELSNIHLSILQGAATHLLSRSDIEKVVYPLPPLAHEYLTLQVKGLSLRHKNGRASYKLPLFDNLEYSEEQFTYMSRLHSVVGRTTSSQIAHLTLAKFIDTETLDCGLIEDIDNILPNTITFQGLEVLSRYSDVGRSSHVDGDVGVPSLDAKAVRLHRPGGMPAPLRQILHASLAQEVTPPPVAIGE